MITPGSLALLKEKPPRFNLFENSWLGFLGFFMKRNLGYGQRKALNLLNEVIELACLAWVMDVSFLKSFVLIPLGHLLVNYLQEYHWQLFRFAPSSWFKKIPCVLDLGLWITSAFVLTLIGLRVFHKLGPDPILGLLFSFRLVSLLFQLVLAPMTARVTVKRRVRPNLSLLWSANVLTWIICIGSHKLAWTTHYAVFVGICFNVTKIVIELSYYQMCKTEKHRLRLIDAHVTEDPKTLVPILTAGGLVGLHLLILGLLSYKFHQMHFTFAAIFVFFILAAFDRITSRPLRCLSIDFSYLDRLHYTHLKDGLLRRVLLISGLFCLTGIFFVFRNQSWPILALSAFALTSINGTLCHAILFGRIKLRGTQPLINWILILLLFSALALNPFLPFGLQAFIAIQTLLMLFAINLISTQSPDPTDHRPLLIQFEWNPILPLWGSFLEHLEETNSGMTALNRKTKVLHLREDSDWNDLLNRFPLNIRNSMRIESLPDRPNYQMPDGAKPMVLSFFGFWKSRDRGTPVFREHAKFLHETSKNWKRYPFLLGGKRSWKSKSDCMPPVIAGPLNDQGSELWLK